MNVSADSFRVLAPGRVNLIGEHTDYTGGLVLPMAIDRWTVIEGTRLDGRIELTSANEPEPVSFDVPIDDPRRPGLAWGRYVAAVAGELAAAGQVPGTRGMTGHVTTDIPVGAGLSSSAALEVAAALALGYDGDRGELAAICQRAEFRATLVPTGIMDQLIIATAVEGHASMIDCATLQSDPVALPGDLEIVVRFIAHRTLEGSEYGDRVAQCAQAEAIIGPLRDARLDDLSAITDPLIRSRARHVISENQRVRDFAAAVSAADLVAAGEIMIDGHRSLRDDFATSVPVMDAAVDALNATPGVFGARMTGGGFGGCLVALARPGVLSDGWIVRPVEAARRVD